MPAVHRPQTPEEWRKALDDLPSTPDRIPIFFFAHGTPVLLMDPPQLSPKNHMSALYTYGGAKGPQAAFLRDFGPALLSKYKPKGIVVFSAHFETNGERWVTDYGDENPLLYDYYGFSPEMYQVKFKSRGDTALAKRVVQLYHDAGQKARLTPKTEPRGEDGRGFSGSGLDHGVFVPFKVMFGDELLDIPIVQVSIDSSLKFETTWQLGKAVGKLRDEGILVLAGGLTVHNLRDMVSFSPETAKQLHRDFDQAVYETVAEPDPEKRKDDMSMLGRHPGFFPSHPREDHFVPLYVAAGAGEAVGGEVKIVSGLYGAPTIAFGV